jgi:hypothetical protein
VFNPHRQHHKISGLARSTYAAISSDSTLTAPHLAICIHSYFHFGLRQSRRFDDLLACGGQTGQRQCRFWFTWRRMQRRFLEPEVELVTAAVSAAKAHEMGCQFLPWS